MEGRREWSKHQEVDPVPRVQRVPPSTFRNHSEAIFSLAMKISDKLRAEAVADYLSGGKTQQQVCAHFEARTGLRLAPRTLRSWISSVPGAALPDDLRVHLVRALEQLREIQHHVLAILEAYPGRADDPDPVAAEWERPAARDAAAATLAAAAGVPVGVLIPTEPAAAPVPPGINVPIVPPPAPKNEGFWE